MRYSLEDLHPGLTLATSLLESGGRLLLPAGTVLTERHIRYFQMWGVVQVDIEGAESGTAAASTVVDPAVQAEAETRLERLFRHADRTHPAVAEVYAYCLTREVRRLSNSGSHGG